MRRCQCLLVGLLGLASVAVPAQEAKPEVLAEATQAGAVLTAQDIMARVAANQDRSEQARKQYVYRQHIHVIIRKTNGRLMREETTDYRMVPEADKTQRTLEKVTGKYWKKGKYEEFTGEPVPDEDSIDAGILKGFRDDLIETNSRDGLGRDQYPFVTEELKKYVFKLVGQETFRGHAAYHIGFGPVDKTEYDWAGEAYIDAADFEPIYVYTKLPRKLPLAVRTLLGTDIPGYGYSLTYEKQAGGVWFPRTYGTEFALHVLFFLNREIMISLDNKDFQQTHVETKITAEATGEER